MTDRSGAAAKQRQTCRVFTVAAAAAAAPLRAVTAACCYPVQSPINVKRGAAKAEAT